MSKSKAKPGVERIAFTFDLFDLPTAQHKAGLAGLAAANPVDEGSKDRPGDASRSRGANSDHRTDHIHARFRPRSVR